MIPIDKLQATGAFLLAQERVRLLLHKHPDGDTLGSSLALARFLKQKGMDIGVFGPFPRAAKFDFLPGFEEVESGVDEIRNPEYADTLYVVVDSTGVDRTGFEEGDFKRLLRLDHHIGGSRYSEYDLVDTSAGAAALIISDLLHALDKDGIDAGTATCLYTGLMTDTGGFRYTNTNSHVFHSVARLVDQGASPAEVATMVYDRRNPSYLLLLKRALESIEFHAEGRLAMLTLTAAGLPEEALLYFGEDDFINLPRGLAQVEVVVQMKLVPGENWKVGFRAKGKVNVQEIATHFGGGGHFSAAGCEIDGELEEVRHRVLTRVLEAISAS
ncbi:MAG: bifunctional oligoribonuclease/PAP phosphatase NrnA [bacterium]|nr:bifunctional oligoribonuclease/PAP phosphatase NrnA [bacterium]